MVDYSTPIKLALELWREQGRSVSGAYVKGSVAQLGYVAPGSDIDLCMITPSSPEPAWFEEKVLGNHTVEIYPMSKAALSDAEAMLVFS